MATYAYLIDPEKQFETKSGTLNVAGKLRVFDASTDDPVVTYKDFAGTENEEEIELDNNGRAIVIADSAKAYRLEVYDRYGTLLWTTTPLWCQAGGGGASIARTDIVSSDGTVEITKTVVGSTTTFDLSTDVDDSTDLLEWIRCDGATLHDNGCYCPTYTAGTMEVGDHGVTLYAARYYHITGHIKAVKPSSAVPFYDDVVVHFIGHNVDTDEEFEFQSFKLDADYSMAMDQVFEVSTDIISGADIELYIKIDNADISGATFTLEDLSIHRVFSGMPALPGGAASKPWAEENFQPILTPGTGIEISEDNVISATAAQQQQADWAQANTGEVDYIKNKPDLGIYAEKTEVADTYQEKLIAGDNIVLDGNIISATAEPQRNADWNANSGVEEILNKPDLSVYATKEEVSDTYQEKLIAGDNIVIEGNTISATAEPQEQADWNETNSSDVSYIKNKPDLSIYATTGDVATGLEGKQDVLTAGNNITIENNVISATSEAQVQSDWAQANSSEADYIKNKPETVGLVAGNNITIQDNGYTLTISADAAPQVQSDWAETNSSDVSYIKNKPDLSIYATTSSVATELEGKQDVLTAGSNITINNNVISATAEPQVQSDWNETNSSEVDYIKNKPDLSIYATTSDMATALADKQDTLTAGSNITIENNVISAPAAPQEQSDWNETNSGEVDYIKNKPDLSIYATTSSVNTALADKQDTLTAGDNITITNNVISATAAPQEQADWDETNSSDVSYIKNKPVLSSAATKAITAGANISISETSTEIQISSTGGGQLEQVQSDWAQANSSDVSYIKNKPEIGNLVAGSGITITSSGSDVTISANAAQQEQADWNETNSSEVDYIKNKPDLSIYATTSAMTTALADKQDTLTAGSNITINNNVISATAAPQVNSDWNATSGPAEILNKPDLSVYATQTDLADKQDTLTAGTNITIENNVISAAGGTQVNSDWDATSGPAEILNKPDLSQYATLTDLANKQDTLTAGTGISINQNNVISSTVAPQVNSDWTATSGVQEILHKPEQLQLVAPRCQIRTHSHRTRHTRTYIHKMGDRENAPIRQRCLRQHNHDGLLYGGQFLLLSRRDEGGGRDLF